MDEKYPLKSKRVSPFTDRNSIMLDLCTVWQAWGTFARAQPNTCSSMSTVSISSAVSTQQQTESGT